MTPIVGFVAHILAQQHKTQFLDLIEVLTKQFLFIWCLLFTLIRTHSGNIQVS